MKNIPLLILYVLATGSYGQNTIPKFQRDIDINFLSSYYEQDGENAAVTGGIGTEKLSNIANIFVLNVPIDSINAISLYGGADYYSSASTDNIDFDVTSASSSDTRGFGTLTYTRLVPESGRTYAGKIGFSSEYDYTSFSAGISLSQAWHHSNTVLNLSAQAFIDRWAIIFPEELRGEVSLSSPNRQSFNAQISLSQVITRKIQLRITADFVMMNGLLSTPFHRVYFNNDSGLDIERLPQSRIKVPLSVRLNLAPSHAINIRTYYRYYWDDFGVQGHTASLEIPIRIKESFSISPFVRYHTQTASTYFAPYKSHSQESQYYTSDYDLSALKSQKYGISFKYYPVFGILRSKPVLASKRVFMLKYIEFRGAYYQRDTGLQSYIGSINLAFVIK